MKSDNPYRTISQKVAYQTPWITIREDQITHPDGRPGLYSVLELPGFAGIVPMDDDGGIYLVREWRYPIDQWSWEIPGGRLDANEAPEVSAKRELLEETGLKAAEMTMLGRFYPLNGVSNDLATVFLAKQLNRVSDTLDSEVQQFQKFELAEILTMIDDNVITDGKTIGALFKVCRYLEAHP